MSNYGDNGVPADVIPDWLLGGNRKRRVIQALAADQRVDGWRVQELVDALGCGRATAFEIVRALRQVGAIEDLGDGRVRLARRGDLAEAIRDLLHALEPFHATRVDRPLRGSRRT